MEIERKYNLKILEEKEYKKGYILNTSRGRMYLKSTDASQSTLLFYDSIYDHMEKNNFSQLLSPYKAKDGKSYFLWEDKLYQLFLWNIEDQDAAPYDIVKFMIDFHRSSYGFKAIPGSRVKTEWGRWIWVFRSLLRYGIKTQEILENKRKKERTEKIFIENFNKYYKIGLESIKELENTSYLSIVRESMDKNELSICNFSKKNFRKNDDHPLILVSLEDVKHDILIIDLGNLILENIKEIKNINEILKNYHKMSPLNDDELKIIRAYVAFPQEYFRIIEKYYKNKKDIQKGYWNKKMKKAIKFERLKETFINMDLRGVVKEDDYRKSDR